MTQESKIMIVNPLLCTGCLECELVCSVCKTGKANPSDARIKIAKDVEGDICFPITCRHCDPAPCGEICPTGAISRSSETGAVLINYDRCIGCKMCLIACPFGAISLDSVHGKAVKCDLCDGDPQCVKFCKPRQPNSSAYMANAESSALQFVKAADASLTKQQAQRNKFITFLLE
jgi:Fe-S-cluster-containing hydrogenase component 2